MSEPPDDQIDAISIHEAAASGNVSAVGKLIRNGVSVNEANATGETPLHLAALGGHFVLVRMLILCHARIFSRNSVGETPLHYAATGGNVAIVEMLLESGAYSQTIDYYGCTPLENAIQARNLGVAVTLMARGAQLELCDEDSQGCAWILARLLIDQDIILISRLLKEQTARSMRMLLHPAAALGATTLLGSLFDHGMDPSAMDRWGRTPLVLALENGNTEAVFLLLRFWGQAANIEWKAIHQLLGLARQGAGLTRTLLKQNRISAAWILTIALQDGVFDAFLWALGHMAMADIESEVSTTDPTMIDCHGRTLLHEAATRGEQGGVAALLANGADIQAYTHSGATALHCASASPNEPALQYLLDHGAQKDARDYFYHTSLHLAAGLGHLSVVDRLLSAGADITAQAVSGSTPLHYAAMGGHSDVVAALLAAGADITARDVLGYRPLHHAAHCGHAGVVQTLAARETDVDATTAEGDTALLLAARAGQTDALRALIQHGAALTIHTAAGESPLQLAARCGAADTVALLLESGCSPAATDSAGSTALHDAASGGHERSVELLLNAGAPPDSHNAADLTPLLLAVRGGHSGAVRVLLEREGAVYDLARALREAVAAGSADSIRLLVAHGANLEAPWRGLTPLQAALRSSPSVAELLLDMGAQFTEQTALWPPISLMQSLSNRTPLEIEKLLALQTPEHRICLLCEAVRVNSLPMVRTLLQLGVSPEAPPGLDPLLVTAALSDSVAIIQLLLDNGADTAAVSREKGLRSPLHFAAERGSAPAVAALLRSGANAKARDADGFTPYDLAPLGAAGQAVRRLLSIIQQAPDY